MPKCSLYVELIDHTAFPVSTIAKASRLCYSAAHVDELSERLGPGGEEKQLERLMAMGHLSPIEHASFTFAVEGVSRALLAQITRHRIASFSVQSQRYVKADALNYILPPSVEALGEEAVAEFEAQMKTIESWYQGWLDKGVEKEDARFVLPNAAETRMILTMNARELMHFFHLRCCTRAQWEIRALAWAMLGLARKAAPALFEDAGPSCLAGPCPEGKMTCGKMLDIRKKSESFNELLKNPEFTGKDIIDWAKQNA